jgi:hypothetical protein
MTAQVVHSDNSSLLRNTLRANSLFSTGSGLLFIIGAGGIASFLGVPNASLIILLMGIALLGFAALVFTGTVRPELTKRIGWVAFEMDVLWVVGSVVILAADAFGLSTEGDGRF